MKGSRVQHAGATSGASASPGVDRALQLARRELSPTTADKALGRAALGLPAPPPAPPSQPLGWGALRASGKVGACVSAVLIGVGFGAGYWLGRTEPPAERPSPAAQAALPAPLANHPVHAAGTVHQLGSTERAAAVQAAHAGAPEQALPVPPAAGLPSSTARPGHATKPRRSSAAAARESAAPDPGRGTSTTPARSGADELALLRRIERALRNDQPALALALLAESEARFADSALQEERRAAHVMAHCGLRDAGYERRAQEFLRSRPRSVYRARVLAACGGARISAASNDRALPGDGKPERGD